MRTKGREFPGCPVVRAPYSHCPGPGFDLCQGTRTTWYSQKIVRTRGKGFNFYINVTLSLCAWVRGVLSLLFKNSDIFHINHTENHTIYYQMLQPSPTEAWMSKVLQKLKPVQLLARNILLIFYCSILMTRSSGSCAVLPSTGAWVLLWTLSCCYFPKSRTSPGLWTTPCT